MMEDEKGQDKKKKDSSVSLDEKERSEVSE